MSYDLDIHSSIVEPDILKKFSKLYFMRKVVRKWAVTQEETITKQLDAGVRYFDLRIARKPNDSNPTRLYFYHGLYTRTDVETVLQEIHDWALLHPKEILILALSHFKGFTTTTEESLHTHLIHFIKTLFGDKLVSISSTPTLELCWERGNNIIISYDYQAAQDPEIWGNITYCYGNSMNPADVERKLSDFLEKERPSECFFVCGLNLTLPENAGVLKYILCACDTLAKVIWRSLPELIRWLKQEGGKTPQLVNIVASDLVTRGNFVSTVVKLNEKI
ncbi:PI-PLC X domain-containing protein 1-like isoform X2 [Parambassis ranga]|nr:PI-PLC X domain-containing protein 1-like isoform X2 [Parambassis ranga]